MKRVTFNVSDEDHAKIKADADKRGLTISKYMWKLTKVKPLPMGRPKKKGNK